MSLYCTDCKKKLEYQEETHTNMQTPHRKAQSYLHVTLGFTQDVNAPLQDSNYVAFYFFQTLLLLPPVHSQK